MSDLHKGISETQYLSCPHWENEYHEAWKIESGLRVELTPPGKEEHTLQLCPICTKLVEAEILRRITAKAVRAHWLDNSAERDGDPLS